MKLLYKITLILSGVSLSAFGMNNPHLQSSGTKRVYSAAFDSGIENQRRNYNHVHRSLSGEISSILNYPTAYYPEGAVSDVDNQARELREICPKTPVSIDALQHLPSPGLMQEYNELRGICAPSPVYAENRTAISPHAIHTPDSHTVSSPIALASYENYVPRSSHHTNVRRSVSNEMTKLAFILNNSQQNYSLEETQGEYSALCNQFAKSPVSINEDGENRAVPSPNIAPPSSPHAYTSPRASQPHSPFFSAPSSPAVAASRVSTSPQAPSSVPTRTVQVAVSQRHQNTTTLQEFFSNAPLNDCYNAIYEGKACDEMFHILQQRYVPTILSHVAHSVVIHASDDAISSIKNYIELHPLNDVYAQRVNEALYPEHSVYGQRRETVSHKQSSVALKEHIFAEYTSELIYKAIENGNVHPRMFHLMYEREQFGVDIFRRCAHRIIKHKDIIGDEAFKSLLNYLRKYPIEDADIHEKVMLILDPVDFDTMLNQMPNEQAARFIFTHAPLKVVRAAILKGFTCSNIEQIVQNRFSKHIQNELLSKHIAAQWNNQKN